MMGQMSASKIFEQIRAGFELVEHGEGCYLIQFPFTFRNGDWLPVCLERHGAGWRLTDGAELYGTLWAYTTRDFFRGQLGKRVRSVAQRYEVHIEEGMFVRNLEPSPDVAFADFVRALLEVENVILDLEARRPSRERSHLPA